jgi:hypothetical protein
MTEGVFAESAAPPEGTFDAWDPQNVANLVGFLAAPGAADINGQIFVVFGASIWAMSAFVPVGQVTRDHAWTPQELLDAKGELFSGIDSAIGPFELI